MRQMTLEMCECDNFDAVKENNDVVGSEYDYKTSDDNKDVRWGVTFDAVK